jgi:hypothetical protein
MLFGLPSTSACGNTPPTLPGTPGGTIDGIVVGPGSTVAGCDFGQLSPSTISGTVFKDHNNDGIKNGSDSGQGGATVEALFTASTFVAPTSWAATTPTNGRFSFNDLYPGEYKLIVSPPAPLLTGKVSTDLGTGCVNGSTPDHCPGESVNTQSVTGMSLVGDNSYANALFGELDPASITYRVFDDKDGSGTYTSGDTTLTEAQGPVTLTGVDDLGDPVSRSYEVTQADGSRIFTELRPSDGNGYALTLVPPAGFNLREGIYVTNGQGTQEAGASKRHRDQLDRHRSGVGDQLVERMRSGIGHE